MPKLLRDFRCHECSKLSEKFVDTSINEVRCEHCGGVAIRIIGMPRVTLDGTDPAFPTAYDRWANIREQNRRVKGQRSYREP